MKVHKNPDIDAYIREEFNEFPFTIKRACSRCGKVLSFRDIVIKYVYENDKHILIYPRCPVCNAPLKVISYRKEPYRKALHNCLKHDQYIYWRDRRTSRKLEFRTDGFK